MDGLTDFTLAEKKFMKIKCMDCYTEITVYYSEVYKGHRGKCLICKIDFPLD